MGVGVGLEVIAVSTSVVTAGGMNHVPAGVLLALAAGTGVGGHVVSSAGAVAAASVGMETLAWEVALAACRGGKVAP